MISDQPPASQLFALLPFICGILVILNVTRFPIIGPFIFSTGLPIRIVVGIHLIGTIVIVVFGHIFTSLG